MRTSSAVRRSFSSRVMTCLHRYSERGREHGPRPSAIRRLHAVGVMRPPALDEAGIAIGIVHGVERDGAGFDLAVGRLGHCNRFSFRQASAATRLELLLATLR